MSEAFTIRQATLADVPMIVTHRRQMFEDIGHTNSSGLDQMDRIGAEWLYERVANGRYLGWFALNAAGDIVAGAGLWLQDWPPNMIDQEPYRGYILNVYTRPEYRQRGLARRLVETIIDWCSQRGIITVGLHASSQGRPIYEGLGFGSTNEMRLLLIGDGQ
ncbi:MAG: GNAT family N-acetyltransferase [Anaerolineae bacterium]|nr:GNAT family N-acetyltransferase [Anaerolineae bacterium]